MKEEYNKLFEKAFSPTSDDELLRAVTGRKKRRMVRSVFIPIGAAAALALSLFVTAAVVAVNRNMLQSSNNEKLDMKYLDYKLPVGIYYLGGNKNSDIWFEVTNTTIQLKGKDLEKTFREDAALMRGPDRDGNSDEASLIKYYMAQFPCSPCEYTVYGIDPDALTEAIATGNTQNIGVATASVFVLYTPEDGMRHAVGYHYETKSIKEYFGEFVWTGA